MNGLDDFRGMGPGLGLLWAVALLATATWGTGLAEPGDAASSKTVWNWQGRYVRIVPQDARDAPPNDHPVKLTPRQIGVMLDELRVEVPRKKRFFSRDNKGQQDVVVFSDRELEVLSDALSRALAKAGPREDVVFFTSGNYDLALGGTLKERAVNTGRVFYRDHRLNIIFGEVHGAFPQPRGAGALEAYPAKPLAQGSRKGAAPHEWRLLPDPAVQLYREGAHTRTDWVLVDPETAMARYEQRQRLEEKAEPKKVVEETSRLAAEQEALRRKVEELEQEVHGEKAAGQPAQGPGAAPAGVAPAAAAGAAAAVKGGSAAPQAVSPSQADLERQLRVLKRLHEQGLITDEMYEKEVSKVLEEGL